MPKKVALIRPNINRWKLYKWYSSLASNEPPLGLLSIASYLDQNKIPVKIYDGEQLSDNLLFHKLNDYQPEIIGITTTTFSYHRAVELSKKIKNQWPNAQIYLGGSHVSAQPKESLDENPFLTGCIIGEGEEALLMLAENRPLASIPNLITHESNGSDAKPVQREPKLDRYKLNWSLLSGFPEKYQPGIQDRKNGRVTSLVASRGCDYSCTFCASHKLHGTGRRAYSPQMICDQIVYLNVSYGISNIYFHDDNFTQDKDWLNEFCALLSNSAPKVNWSCATRVEALDKRTLQMMKNAGCYQLGVGLESCSSSILKWMNKQSSIDQLQKKIELIHSLGIKTKIYFIIGTPVETFADLFNTLKFVIKLGANHVQITYYTPLPGALDYKRYPIEKQDWPKLNLLNPTKHASLTTIQLRLFEFLGYSLFYSIRLIRLLFSTNKGNPEVSGG